MALLHRGYAELGAMGFRYRAVNQSVEVTRTRIADGEGYIAVRDDESVGTHLIRLYERRGYRNVGIAQWDHTNYRSILLSKRLA